VTRSLAVTSAILGALVSVGLGAYVVRLAEAERTDPARCGAGLVPTGARCCASGQHLEKGRCAGLPASCPTGLHVAESRNGCAIDAHRVFIAGGTLSPSNDWQSEGAVVPRDAKVPSFVLDTSEVTVERWQHCARAGACREIDALEPGIPVTDVDAKEAEKFCRFEGGRLPTSEEWLFAAMGPEGRRFPWGMTGLVCRRAAFGIEAGPCATGGGLEISGSRPDGATPTGIQDLSGNAAEWTTERDGKMVARGGSYRSTSASTLTSFGFESPQTRAAHVGFRCAFSVEQRRPQTDGLPASQ
jgi:formylglycine-generating enzyme required for sulfatase activity